jgi:hypothetical protein
MSLVEARLKPLIDLYECLETFDAAFDLDKAVGEQLDTIGEYVGIKRLLTFQPMNASALLSDFYYRILLKARISLNNWDGTTDEITRVWQDILPDYVIQIVDNQDMSMLVRTYNLQSYFTVELIQHGYFNPKPMGVLVKYEAVTGIIVTLPVYHGAVVNTSLREVFSLEIAAGEVVSQVYEGAVILTSERGKFGISFNANALRLPRAVSGIVSTTERETFGFALNARITPREYRGIILSTTERGVF